MNTIQLWWSSVGKKVLNGLSGLALFGFVLVHLAGNLTLFVRDNGVLFNTYAHKLHSLGPILWAMEAGLIVFFLTHIVSAVSVRLSQREGRPVRYAVDASKGGPSRKTFSSRSMLWTGILLAVFVVLHVKMFKYGAHYETTLPDGTVVRNLYRLVVEQFQNDLICWAYVVTMFLLGLHLRHGFWSGFQSLGALTPKYATCVQRIGYVFAALIAVGFLLIPLYLCYGPITAGGAP